MAPRPFPRTYRKTRRAPLSYGPSKVPARTAASPDWTGLAWLTGFIVIFLAIGFADFRRRPLRRTLGGPLAHQEGGPLHAVRRSWNDQRVDDWVAVATSLLAEHPAVLSVEFAGSRSRGTHAELSDWDFAVETSDFDALARDLPALVAPLKPLAQQWEPMGHFPVPRAAPMRAASRPR